MKFRQLLQLLATVVLVVVVVFSLLPTALPATAQVGCTDTVRARLAELNGFPDKNPNPCQGNSGRFIDTSRGLATLGDVLPGDPVFSVELAIPASYDEFTLSIFDGDMGGKWDRLPPGGWDQNQFELYADPGLIGGESTDILYTWDTDLFVDDQWCELDEGGGFSCVPGADGPGVSGLTLSRVERACPGWPDLDGNCYYHLLARWKTEAHVDESNFFKVAVRGQPFLMAGSTIGFQAKDLDYNHDMSPTEYDGEFVFDFFVPQEAQALDLFDGDFDHRDDTVDGNTPSDACRGPLVYEVDPRYGPCDGYWSQNVCVEAYANNQDPDSGCSILMWNQDTEAWEPVMYPPFQQSSATLAQGANPGAPRDDIIPGFAPPLIFPPDIQYTVTAPGGLWTRTNDDPSGNNEWELYRIGLQGANTPAPDVEVPEIPAGLYTWNIQGADAMNNLFVHTLYNLFSGTDGACNLVATKSCAVADQTAATYEFTVANTSTTDRVTEITLVDSHLGVVAGPFDLEAGASQTVTVVKDLFETEENVVTATGYQYVVEKLVYLECTANASAVCTVRMGCTPGYWQGKNNADSWAATGYAHEDSYLEVFGIEEYAPISAYKLDTTLDQVVGSHGKGEATFAAHAVAALLNASHPEMDYFFTPEQVITMVQQAYATCGDTADTCDFEPTKNLLDEQNSDETYCPLN